ncbi:MAG: hypothetical protein IMZ61_02545 [Planctomycetes bacterium]|nr:hypothetical protein [Planctomycetota bacterium]
MKVKSKTSKQLQRAGMPAGQNGGPWSIARAAKRFALPLLVFCWPILYLFRHVFVINGQYTAIGNDFISLYCRYKIYLLANLAEFRFPLWSPSEAAGFPFYTNPFAQMFYPINLILVAWYKILGGYSVLDHQLFTVLGISIFALGLYMWLSQINKNIRAVLFATLIMSVSFKVTEIIRFPNAVHTAAWYPWALYAMTKIILSPSLKKAVQYGALLAFSLICICTGGYPYYAYYTIFLFMPYLLAFLIKPLRIRFIGPAAINLKRAIFTLVLAGIVAGLICGPYILGIKHLMSQTIDRAGKSFEYSTSHIFNFEDTLGSLVYPPAASTEGWYFFSITALLIILMYLFSRNRKIQNSGQNQNDLNYASAGEAAIKLFLFAWIATITYISYGRSSYLFTFLWKFLPGFSSLRIWGRLNIILVPIIAWLLSLAYSWFEDVISGDNAPQDNNKKWSSKSIIILLCSYAVILGVQLYLYLYNVRDELWAQYFDSLAPHRVWFIVYGAVAAAVLVLVVILGRRKIFSSRKYLKAVPVVLVLLAVIEMRHTAVHIWTRQQQWEPGRTKLDMAQINELSFRYRRIDQNFTISLSPVFSVGIVENWYLNSYVQFLKNTQNEPDARRILLGVADGTRVFFSESIQHPSVTSFLKDAARYPSTGRPVSYNGDELNWEIEVPVTGYMSFIDNGAPGWKVWVDDQPTDIELLFGTFKCVRLTPGRHRVRFRYLPEVFQW